MRKLLPLTMALLLALLLPVGIAGAQTYTFTSGFQVQNLESTQATINITFYPQVGSSTQVADTIPANSSKTYFPLTGVSDGFNGSVVISSDKDIRAIVNILGSGPASVGASYTGFSAGSTQVSLPLIMRNNSGYDTFFNVQNAGSANTTVNVTYYPLPGKGNSGVTDSATLEPGRAATFDQDAKSALGSLFVGSAVVTSAEPVVVSVSEVNATTMKSLLAYGGFTGSGSTTINLPLIMSANSGYATGVQVQNVGGSTTDVTLTFGTNIGGSFSPTPETVTGVAPGASANFLQLVGSGQWTGSKYIGSATVSCGSQPCVALVNQLGPMSGSTLPGSSYEGFDPGSATTKIVAPLIMSANSNYHTGIQVQNAGSASTNITVTYGTNTVVGSWTPTAETQTGIAPGASANFLQIAGSGQWTGTRYVGSAVITSSGERIVAIVNEVRIPATGDDLFTYTGFNTTP